MSRAAAERLGCFEHPVSTKPGLRSLQLFDRCEYGLCGVLIHKRCAHVLDLGPYAQPVEHELSELVCVAHGDMEEVVVVACDVEEVDGFRELEQVVGCANSVGAWIVAI
jgi:hypothetical protein